jgi:hypothetical protein
MIKLHHSDQIKNDVIKYLESFCRGRKSAVKADRLAQIHGVNIRVINNVIRELRRSGILIGAAKERPFGYYIPENDQEADACLGAFKGELFDMLETYNTLKSAWAKFKDSQNYPSEELFPIEVDECGQMQLVLSGN